MPVIHPAYWGVSTEYADLDFETYSEAGYDMRTIKKLMSGSKTSIGIVGTAAYAEHPSTVARSLAYDLKDGIGERIWLPCLPPPEDLFNYIAAGGVLAAWNSFFEFKIWKHVCHERTGWPELPVTQLVDDAVKARAFSLPGKLEHAAIASGSTELKSDGGPWITRFCIPRKPTLADPRCRIDPATDPEGYNLYTYNIQDIKAECSISRGIPDLIPSEQELFFCDQGINERGVPIDAESVENAIFLIEAYFEKNAPMVSEITGGAVETVNQHKRIKEWLQSLGYTVYSTDKEAVIELMKQMEPESPEYRLLELRQLMGSAAVKKLYSMRYHRSPDNRARGLFVMNGADRTGRWASYGIQFHNQKSGGPKVRKCENGCGAWYEHTVEVCPRCSQPAFLQSEPVGWNPDAADFAIECMRPRSLEYFERFFPSVINAVGGCLRGMFAAPEGKEIICSDFAAIEAVVMAEMAGEPWQQDVFRTHGKIYEMTASEISGIPFEEIIEYKKKHGRHHPIRKGLGKPASLAGIFCCWIGGWEKQGAMEYFDSEDDLAEAIMKWRSKVPNILRFWACCEHNFVEACLNPGQHYKFEDKLDFWVDNDVLFIKLPSGRKLTYHEPKVWRGIKEYHDKKTGRTTYKEVWNLSYVEWNTDKKKGPINSWLRVDAWRGIIVENIIQAIARDLLAFSLVSLSKAGYDVIFHTHDEVGAEIPEGTGNIAHFEAVGSMTPWWAAGWPIKMAGGWIAKRYRKD